MSVEPSDRPAYSTVELSALVGRHAHDLRNVLNGMELEFVLLEERSTAGELRDLMGRLRRSLAQADRLIKLFSAKFVPEKSVAVPARDVAEQWRADTRTILQATHVTWSLELSGAVVRVEMGGIRGVLFDLLAIAVRISHPAALHVRCHPGEDWVNFDVAAEVDGDRRLFRNEMDDAAWTGLRRVVARNGARLEPACLLDHPNCPLRLSLPLVRPDPTEVAA